MEKFVEVFLAYHSNCRIILSLDRSRTFGARQKGNLAKVLTRVECADKSLLPVLVLHEAFTLTLGNDEEVIVFFALLDLDFLWLTHDKFNLGYHVVFYV